MKRLAVAICLLLVLAAMGAQAAGGIFVAVSTETSGANAEALATGTTWTSVSTGTSLALGEVAYGNNIFCAVGSSFSTVSYYSSNGTVWTSGGSVGHGANSITYGDGVFVVVAGTGTGFSATSPDCITWTSGGGFNIGVAPKQVAWDSVNAVFIVVVGNSDVWTSTNGSTWTVHSGVMSGTNGNTLATCGGTTIVAGGADSAVSTNGGSSWTQSFNHAIPWNSIACSDSTHFVVVGDYNVGGANHVEYTANAGSSWSNISALDSLNLSSVAWNGAKFVAVGTSTTSFGDSPTGASWTLETGAISLAAPYLAASLTGGGGGAVNSGMEGWWGMNDGWWSVSTTPFSIRSWINYASPSGM